MLPLGGIAKTHKKNFHCYADDTQEYLPLNFQNQANVNRLQNFPQDIKDWLAHNFLHLDEDVAEILVFGLPHHTTLTALNHISAYVRPHTKNLVFACGRTYLSLTIYLMATHVSSDS